MYFGDGVLGGIDGIITTFAIISGAAGANLDFKIIIIIGISSLFADAFSMGVSNYLATKTDLNLMEKPDKNPVISGLITFSSFIIWGVVPLIPYIFSLWFDYHYQYLFIISMIMSLLTFLSIGLLRSMYDKSNSLLIIFETLILGTVAAFIAYIIGDLLDALIL
jgi:VIT1/CCC1 family predicted Fe2+/Mn2+ transporter